MVVRIHALYGGHKGVTAFVATLLAAEIAVQAWLLSEARGEQCMQVNLSKMMLKLS